jgi:transposase
MIIRNATFASPIPLPLPLSTGGCVKTPKFFLILYASKKSSIFTSINQKGMSFIVSTPREQLMLPSSIDGYVSSDNVVRFIDAFVDKALTSAPASLFPKGQSPAGRPCYSSGCLCKLLIYGYLNSISSSRKLENEAKRNLEVIWLMNNLRPDHWTISSFRKDNKALIKGIAIAFRKFLRDSGYINGASVSTDGSKIKAYASRATLSLKLVDKKLSQAEKEVARYLSLLNENDAVELEQEEMLAASGELKNQLADLQQQVEALRSQKQLLEKHGRQSLAPADHGAKVMKTKDGFLPAYNVQATVDNDFHLIATCEATDYPNDFHSLEENVNTLKEQLGITPKTCLADGGYANEEQVQSLEKRGVECIVPFPNGAESKKVQRDGGARFTYDEKADCFSCSQGKTLPLAAKNCKKKNHFFNKYQCKECAGCPVKERCTTSKTGRMIFRRVSGEWLRSRHAKQETKAFKEALKKRKCVVEHPFGTMRRYMGQIPILLRGKEKVQVEVDLYATGYNLIRLKNIEAVPALLEKLALWQPASAFLTFLAFLSLFFSKKKGYTPLLRLNACSYIF